MSDVLTISSVLKGVSPLITVAGLQTILAKRGLTGDEEYAALPEKDRDLAEGTAYYWLSNLPTSGGTSKVQDGGWAKSEGVDLLHLPKKFDIHDEDASYEFLKRYHYGENVDGKNELRFSYDYFKSDFPEEALLSRIEMFDEPVVKQILLEEFHRTFPENDGGYKAAMKRELKRQLAELEA